MNCVAEQRYRTYICTTHTSCLCFHCALDIIRSKDRLLNLTIFQQIKGHHKWLHSILSLRYEDNLKTKITLQRAFRTNRKHSPDLSSEETFQWTETPPTSEAPRQCCKPKAWTCCSSQGLKAIKPSRKTALAQIILLLSSRELAALHSCDLVAVLLYSAFPGHC